MLYTVEIPLATRSGTPTYLTVLVSADDEPTAAARAAVHAGQILEAAYAAPNPEARVTVTRAVEA